MERIGLLLVFALCACAGAPLRPPAPPPSAEGQRAARAEAGLVDFSFPAPGGVSFPLVGRGEGGPRWLILGAAWMVPDVLPLLEGPLWALDPRGRSGIGPGPGMGVFEQDVADIEALLAHIAGEHPDAPPPYLLAHGYHALVAAAALANSPGRFSALYAVAPLPARARGHLAAFEGELARRMEGRALAQVEARVVAGERSLELAARLEELLLGPRFADPRLAATVRADPYVAPVQAEALLELNRRALEELGDYDLAPRLAGIRGPVVVVHGLGDALSRESSREFAAAIQGARLVELERSGAFPWIEAPAALGALLPR